MNWTGQYCHPLGTVYRLMPSQGAFICVPSSGNVVRVGEHHTHGCQPPGFSQCRNEAGSRLRDLEDAQLEAGKVQQPLSHIGA